jgi:hypothetical protein
MISELAALLTEFAGSAVPDLMDAQEILVVDCDVPTEAAEEEVIAEPSDKSSEEHQNQTPVVRHALSWPRLLSLFRYTVLQGDWQDLLM